MTNERTAMAAAATGKHYRNTIGRWALLPMRTGVNTIVGRGRGVFVGVGAIVAVAVGSNGVSSPAGVTSLVGGTGVTDGVAVIATGGIRHHCSPVGVGVTQVIPSGVGVDD